MSVDTFSSMLSFIQTENPFLSNGKSYWSHLFAWQHEHILFTLFLQATNNNQCKWKLFVGFVYNFALTSRIWNILVKLCTDKYFQFNWTYYRNENSFFFSFHFDYKCRTHKHSTNSMLSIGHNSNYLRYEMIILMSIMTNDQFQMVSSEEFKRNFGI